MRTTLTLDPDVADALERQQAKRKTSFKETVNEALRLGLDQLARQASHRPRFHTRPVSLKPRVTNVDDVAELLALAEGEDFT